MDIKEIIQQPEGRRLEFKAELPTNAELSKSIIAFANDAGGEFIVGIQDNPREVVGVDEEKLIAIEETISNIIHDQCAPTILPEIIFYNVDGIYIIRTKIHKGSQPPYYITSKGIEKGTFIRVGSSNRLASKEIIDELERQKRNVSFDSELVFSKSCSELMIQSIKELFLAKAGEELTPQVLSKLELVKTEQGRTLPTNALILLSDDELHQELFPYAKIECALFKGTVPGNFIDQKTITGNVALQAEQAYQFVLRHISQGSTDYQGVYRNDRWEYPIIAIREVIRNAVIHRDYALNGKDIKIAIFDDKIEITSPGKLMPSVDYSLMDSGQSDIRNKILAPVFKKLGIIEQWGNGLRLIADELSKYPEIELSWKEPGIAFRITFTNTQHELQPELQPELQQELQQETLYSAILMQLIDKPLNTKELSQNIGQKEISGQLRKILRKLHNDQLIANLFPDNPTHPGQKHKLTEMGQIFLNLLDNARNKENN